MLSDYLSGIPEYNQTAALNAAALSVYDQHVRLMRSAATLASPSQRAELYTEVEGLVSDAKEMLATGQLSGHAFHKASMVANLNLNSVMASLRFAARHPTAT